MHELTNSDADLDAAPCRCARRQVIWGYDLSQAPVYPLCDECERYHCPKCGHPWQYGRLQMEPQPCGCVNQVRRSVRRREGDFVVTYTTDRRASLCAQHRAEIEAPTHAGQGDEYGEWSRVTAEDARRAGLRRA